MYSEGYKMPTRFFNECQVAEENGSSPFTLLEERSKESRFERFSVVDGIVHSNHLFEI